jgi:nitrate/nitrite transport system substrate-binding protein
MIKSLSRRSLLKSSALTLAAANSLLAIGAAYASDAPEVNAIKLGFIALTDSSPLIIAKEKGSLTSMVSRALR